MICDVDVSVLSRKRVLTMVPSLFLEDREEAAAAFIYAVHIWPKN